MKSKATPRLAIAESHCSPRAGGTGVLPEPDSLGYLLVSGFRGCPTGSVLTEEDSAPGMGGVETLGFSFSPILQSLACTSHWPNQAGSSGQGHLGSFLGSSFRVQRITGKWWN